MLMPVHLFIISRQHNDLYDYLRERLAGDGDVRVIKDRRLGERRRKAAPAAAERRRAAMFILEVWRDLTRDLLLAGLGELAAVHDPALIDDLLAVAAALPAGEMRAFLGRLAKAGELLEANVGAELALDSLILAWPRAAA